jgi:hypothetical protein
MSDTREELIEIICDGTLKTEICTTDTHLECETCKGDCGYCTILADHLIANGVTFATENNVGCKWISVSERLPEDDDQLHFYDDGRMRCITVLAYTEYGRTIPKNRLLIRPTGNEYLDRQVTDGWIWASGTEKVTHWMPLPEPPKGEKQCG